MELPSDFIIYTQNLLGKEGFERLASALGDEQPVSIRLNDKLPATDTASFTDVVPWCPSGRYLKKRLTFTFDPLFHAGAYYVQEASSMFLEQVLRQFVTEPVTMLDLCAAPGGKSTHALSTLPEGSLLVSNEISRPRAYILAENMMKWGQPNCIVSNNGPADFNNLENIFDVLLTDMPCSGEGMFRKDQGAIDEWSSSNVTMCAQRQWDIIGQCWPCLRPGGLLIYSTCTFNTLENEENVWRIAQDLGAEILEVKTEPDWNITGNLWSGHSFPVYRFLPGTTRGEGFFMAVLRKNGVYRRKDKSNKSNKAKKLPSIPNIRDLMTKANSWITCNDSYRLTTDGKTIAAFAKQHQATAELLSKELHLMHRGVTIGEIKGRDLIPSQSLAQSKLLCPTAFASQPIGYTQAIAYLRHENIVLDATAPRGCVLLTYHGLPLGFVKNMGNRTNNLYPQEWRIRSGYNPDEISQLIQ